MAQEKVRVPEAIRLYGEGWPLTELGLRYGVAYQTVGRALVAQGVVLRGRAKTERSRKRLSASKRIDLDYARDQIAEWAAAGQTTRQMGPALGVSEEVVRERMIEWGIPRQSTAFPGAKNPAWKGGRKLDKHGYVLVYRPDHPQATNGCVREHRLVAETMLGRPLTRREVVHHRNGIRGDNRPENLEVFASNGAHLRHELAGRKRLLRPDGRPGAFLPRSTPVATGNDAGP